MGIGNLGKTFIASWISLGVSFENTVSNEDETIVTLYISVPESSETTNKDGNMMAGDLLATKLKGMLRQMTKDKIKFNVLYKIRKDEHWTKAMGDAAMKAFLRTANFI